MNTYKKQLFLLKQGDKFKHEDQIYTVYTHEGNMTEVYKDGKFWAWPNWNGKSAVIVNFISYGESQSEQHFGAPIREAA